MLLESLGQIDHFLLNDIEFYFNRRHCLLAQQSLKVVLGWNFDDEDHFFCN
jgi:hypothetical protein